LNNKYEEMILDKFLHKMKYGIKECKDSKESNETATFMPYYDSILDKENRN